MLTIIEKSTRAESNGMMRAVQFDGTFTPGDRIGLPPESDSNLDDVDDIWQKISQQSFLAADAPEDSVYEQLIDDSTIRSHGPNSHGLPGRLMNHVTLQELLSWVAVRTPRE